MDPFASALEQAAALRRGDYSSEELTRAYLERIERLNPELNHYVLVTADLALQMARDGHRGELGGVPVSIKDLVSLAGYPTTFGSRALAGLELPYDSYVVSRLKDAGCPVLGKTNTSEFGTRPVTEHGLFGAARNPWKRGPGTCPAIPSGRSRTRRAGPSRSGSASSPARLPRSTRRWPRRCRTSPGRSRTWATRSTRVGRTRLPSASRCWSSSAREW